MAAEQCTSKFQDIQPFFGIMGIGLPQYWTEYFVSRLQYWILLSKQLTKGQKSTSELDLEKGAGGRLVNWTLKYNVFQFRNLKEIIQTCQKCKKKHKNDK